MSDFLSSLQNECGFDFNVAALPGFNSLNSDDSVFIMHLPYNQSAFVVTSQFLKPRKFSKLVSASTKNTGNDRKSSRQIDPYSTFVSFSPALASSSAHSHHIRSLYRVAAVHNIL